MCHLRAIINSCFIKRGVKASYCLMLMTVLSSSVQKQKYIYLDCVDTGREVKRIFRSITLFNTIIYNSIIYIFSINTVILGLDLSTLGWLGWLARTPIIHDIPPHRSLDL